MWMSVYTSRPRILSIVVIAKTKIPILRRIPSPRPLSLLRIDSSYVHARPTSLQSCSTPHSNLNQLPISTCPLRHLRRPHCTSAWDTCMLAIWISRIAHSTFRPLSLSIGRQCISSSRLWCKRSSRGLSTTSVTVWKQPSVAVKDVLFAQLGSGGSLPNRM
jgi:hypothetical protein